MPFRSVSDAYLAQAADLAGNPGQQAAYDSTGNCVVSGRTGQRQDQDAGAQAGPDHGRGCARAARRRLHHL